MRALVLGLGNPLVADDGFGPRVVEDLGELPPGVEVRVADQYGLYLLDILEGFDFVVVVDVLEPGAGEPGQLLRMRIRASEGAPIAPSPHYTSIEDVLSIGLAMGLRVPREGVLIGVVAQDLSTFGGPMTRPVAAAVEWAREMVMEELRARVLGGR